MIISGEIKRIEDWYCKAGPKDKDTQWKDDYSAKEFAKLWFDKNKRVVTPEPIQILLNKIFGNFDVLFAFPEHVTKIDSYSGGQRNHDMMLFCKKANSEEFIVCIEAKIAEKLDSTISEKLKNVKDEKQSNIPKRIEDMRRMLKMKGDDIAVSELRYQLFTGMVGTIREAENYKMRECFFLVLQILPFRNEDDHIKANLNDVNAFLTANKAKELFGENSSFVYEVQTDRDNLRSYLGYLQIKEKA